MVPKDIRQEKHKREKKKGKRNERKKGTKVPSTYRPKDKEKKREKEKAISLMTARLPMKDGKMRPMV